MSAKVKMMPDFGGAIFWLKNEDKTWSNIATPKNIPKYLDKLITIWYKQWLNEVYRTDGSTSEKFKQDHSLLGQAIVKQLNKLGTKYKFSYTENVYDWRD